ncbi:MAG: hypothetical protein AAF789_12150, partial [Bacteroidota bacterium]
SSSVVSYLNQFQNFQANEIISQGRIPQLDSLFELAPIATLSVEDLSRDDPYVFRIYPKMLDRPFYPVSNEVGTRMVIDEGRVENLLDASGSFSK